MNETPATNTERAGRRSDPETSWRRSGTYGGMWHACLPLRHEGILSSRRAAIPLVRLLAGDERWEASDPLCVLPQNWGGTELNRNVTPV
ncbi:hypothetical protein TNCV_2859791 [Trichonephila clavipes]|nr:hypothetical protein TNCV_2859791 [Trichonephila clavipes]